MKKIFTFFLGVITATSGIAAAHTLSPVRLDSIEFDRKAGYMMVDMVLDLGATEVASSQAQVITPMIVSESGDTLLLPSVGVYGKTRYMIYERNGRIALGPSSTYAVVKSSQRPDRLDYHADVRYAGWMANSNLLIRRSLYGCSNCLVSEKEDRVGQYMEQNPLIPEIVYFQATDTGAKIETLERDSYVDFVVNKTDINPSYRKNPVELPKIQSTIDTVYADPDVTITGIWLKGFASPESPYSHNKKLAIGRTEALKEYVRQMYKFPESLMSTDYEPEDWDGLRKAVETSNIDNRDEILALIDADMDPDAKEAKIKATYPRQYKFMLDNFYPALRHTTYRVTYEIKRFDDINKIREVMRTHPNRLSLREFFILGNAAQPGSEEFNNVYETAVRMYPDNPIANINAANAALQRKDFQTAEMYLDRAGNSPEATYARGALAMMKGEYEKAGNLMEQIPMIPASKTALEEIKKIKQNQIKKTTGITLE